MSSFWQVLDTGEQTETENSMFESDFTESGATTPKHLEPATPPRYEPVQKQLDTEEQEHKRVQEEEPATETDTDNQVDELDSSEVEDEPLPPSKNIQPDVFAVRGMRVENPCVRCTKQNLTCLAQVGRSGRSCVECRNHKSKCSLMTTTPLTPMKRKKIEEGEGEEDDEGQDDQAKLWGEKRQRGLEAFAELLDEMVPKLRVHHQKSLQSEQLNSADQAEQDIETRPGDMHCVRAISQLIPFLEKVHAAVAREVNGRF
ncbi:hypothetical protein PQX77_018922 [Marasmius sp. AFHP31]|nr:hypothetical protein PQX77_018922 [Marasmius sp. AFHP31]